MKATSRIGGGVVSICAIALVFAAARDTSAAVGVGGFNPQGLRPFAGYILGAVGDDPMPTSTIWHPLGPAPGRAELNSEGEINGDGLPSMLVDPATGLLAVAWSRNSAAGFDIVISQFVQSAWTTPQVIVANSANDLDPQLVLDSAGIVHMFYWVDGPTPHVYHTQATEDLSSWSAPILVSQPDEPACRPAGVVYQGTLRVAYERHDFGFGNSPRNVVLARFDGIAFVPEVVAVTNNLGNVSPQVHAHAGHLWVDWVDTETTGHSGEVGWTRLDAQGHWEPIHYQSFSNAEQRDYIVRGSVRVQAIQ